MKIRSFQLVFVLLLLIGGAEATSQSVTIYYYDSTDYVRSPLLREQDLIYGRTAKYSQGLELICLQDKVKAEIQGIGTFYTPVELSDIPPGEYEVELTKTGYYPYVFSIIIRSDGRSSAEVDLKPYVSSLTLEGLPDNAQVYLNNRKIEENKGEVMPGEVSLRIKAFGFDDYFQVITIDDQPEQTFAPELVKRDFALTRIESNRETIWLGDSPSQKRFILSLISEARGEGRYQIEKIADGSLVQEGNIQIENERTNIAFEIDGDDKSDPGDYRVNIKGTDGELRDEAEKIISVKDGRKSQWRNVFSGAAGFLYCTSPDTLPAGVSQIQSGFNPAFTAQSRTDLYIPAFLSMRTALTDRIELTFGTSLYLSPAVDESSIDIFGSGKFMILGYDGSDGFSLGAALSANYNGKAASFGEIPPYDPYGGVSGLSVALPIQYRFSVFSIVLAPEIRMAPSYPMTEPGGFADGDFYLWNYIKGALVFERGLVSAALSAALQTPSYIQGGNAWPFYGGAEISLTPGRTGFSFSLFGGIRYNSGDPILGTAGVSVGLLW